MKTLRVKFKKCNELKYISHLDLMRLFQRAFRRANIPVKYSEGYNPHPKFSFATALAVGVSSDGEYMDVELIKDINPDVFIDKMNQVLPEGIKILKAKYTNSKKSLMALLRWSTYVIELNFESITKEKMQSIIDDILSKEEILITKTKKKRKKVITREVDIRPNIKDISILILKENKAIIKTTLRTGSAGNLKPEVLVEQIKNKENVELIDDETKIQRLDLFIEKNGEIVTPV
ncbi:MAG: DUF2344 domain-containing protein [Firmicutes bacterium]|nr:DUF2344 domain-containing protein [Bacillota bacterium]